MIEGVANCGGDGGLDLDSGEFGHMRIMIADRVGPISKTLLYLPNGRCWAEVEVQEGVVDRD
jgi:hypothetical protein